MIGIVAGVGPYAGLDLLDKILSQTEAEKDQDHLTVISISQPAQIPDRTAFLLSQESSNPAFPILEQLLRLEQAGAQVAAVPCNTAHAPAIFDKIQDGLAQANSQLTLLHMIVEVGRELQRSCPSVKNVGVLSTTGTAVTRIYPLCLEPLGFELPLLDAQTQAERIHPAIYDPDYGIKANGRATERAKCDLMLGIRRLQEAGAQAVILGCTELPLAIPETRIDDLIVIDPALILARALIASVAPDRLKK